MADTSYPKRAGDRREGRQLRSLPGYARMAPYLQRRRSEALCHITDSVEVSGVEQWLREKRGEGWSNLGFLHLLVAAYVRTVSMCPGINRFVFGWRLFARNEIQVILPIKRSPSLSASGTHVKVSLSPNDTVFDVYRSVSAAVDEVKANVNPSDPERLSNDLARLPRPLLRLVMAAGRLMDHFDWLPRPWLDASPFHGSVAVTDLGSLGTPPADVTPPDVGTLSGTVSFGAKRRLRVPDGTASGAEKQYVDYRMVFDSRIADSHYFTNAVKCLKYFLLNPALLELPPERVEDDVN